MMNEIWWPYPLVLVDLGLLIRPNRQHHSTFHVRTSQLHSLNWLSINQKCTLQRQKQHRLGPRIELTISADNSKKSSCWSKSKASKPPPKGYWRVIWKGASSWLSALPIAEHGSALHQGAFRDTLCLRYGWHPPHLPSHCVCGNHFSVEHALSCPRGGFPSIRHNEIRDSLMSEVCHAVGTEPCLQPAVKQLKHQ